MSASVATAMQPVTLPPLVWATGTIHQILVQPGEKFYVFGLRQANNQTVILRIGDPHTGHPLANVTSDNPIFDLVQEAYFRKLTVEVGYRDFGPDPQSGINNLYRPRQPNAVSPVRFPAQATSARVTRPDGERLSRSR